MILESLEGGPGPPLDPGPYVDGAPAFRWIRAQDQAVLQGFISIRFRIRSRPIFSLDSLDLLVSFLSVGFVHSFVLNFC